MSFDQQKTTMNAVVVRHFGGPEVLELEPANMPEPQADEVLIRIHASSVNPVDYKTREGKFPKVGEDQLPWIPGRDFAGVVEFGSFTSAFQRGDEVYGMPGFDRGTYADYVVARATEIARKPTTLDLTEAASVPLAALTAWQGLFDHGGLQPGQSVLILGGAGGVGHMAVQFAKAKGATVIATASAQDVDFLRELGADQAFERDAFSEQVKGVDVVLDLIGGPARAKAWDCLKEGGILVSTVGQPEENEAASRKVRATGYMAQPNGTQLHEIASLIDHMKVRPVIAEVFSLQDVEEAHKRAQAGGFRGKIGLRL